MASVGKGIRPLWELVRRVNPAYALMRGTAAAQLAASALEAASVGMLVPVVSLMSQRNGVPTWYRDADAIHWVSSFDLKALEPDRVEPLTVPTFGWKNWIWARFALLFVRTYRRPSAEQER